MKRLLSLVLAVASLVVCSQHASAQTPTPATTPKPLGETEVKRSGKYYVQVFLEENFKGRAFRIPVPAE